MSRADEIFVSNIKEILETGFSDENLEVRPHWLDGTPAHTIKKFCIVNRYNLQEELPILTIRRTAFKSCLDELLWIWQKKSNNIHDLKSHIWDSWADETGSIGKRYRRQDVIGTPYSITIDDETLNNNTVTIRDRDTMNQITLKLDEVKDYIEEKIRF